MNVDGCEIDQNDLADIADMKEMIMVLCGDEQWSEDSKEGNVDFPVTESNSAISIADASSEETCATPRSCNSQLSRTICDSPGFSGSQNSLTPCSSTSTMQSLAPYSSQSESSTPSSQAQFMSPRKRTRLSVFASKDTLYKYLREHAKSAESMKLIEEGKYSKKARIDITQVTASKLIELYGENPKTSLKLTIATWLAELTNLAPTDFFDGKTHKGYLNKSLENLRLRRSREHKNNEKKNKEKKLPVKKSGFSEACNTVEESDLLNRDGCPRNVADCDYCEGASSESRKSELAKLKSLSSTMYRDELLSAARRTFCYRHTLTQLKKPTFGACVSEMSCYATVPQIILQDFSFGYPMNKDALIVEYDSLLLKVIDYAKTSTSSYIQALVRDSSSESKDQSAIAVLKVLAHLLPVGGRKRVSALEAFKSVFIDLQPGEPLDGLARAHPIVVRHIADSGSMSFKLICDSHVCECGESVLEMMDFLFKFFWVFQLEYPTKLKQFFEFFQFKVFKLADGSHKASPTVNEVGRLFGL